MGHTKILRLLLTDHRVDPTLFDNYAFRHSVIKNHVESIKLMLCDPRIDPGANHEDIFSAACGLGHFEVFYFHFSSIYFVFSIIQKYTFLEEI
jgi:hypothetical protein